MGFVKSLLISLLVFAFLVTFLGPVVYYPGWYACYGVDWIFSQIASVMPIWIGWFFNLIGSIFGLLGSVFGFIYTNWGLFAWCGWII